MTESIDKEFEGYLIVNWKTKEMRVQKRLPKNLSPSEIPIKIELKVKIPQPAQMVAKGEIEVPTYKVNQMVLEAI